MSGPENTFIASVHKHLPPQLYRMKNHNQYNGGIPDVWYSGTKADLWVEYKYVNLPKKDDTVIQLTGGKNPLLSHLQLEWLIERHKEGRNVAVVVGSKLGGCYITYANLTDNPTTSKFRRDTIPRNELARIITASVMD